MAKKTLNGREISAEINVDDVARPYKATSSLAGKFYHVGRWGTLGFTCSPEFYTALKAGKVQQVTLEESTYKRLDPATNTQVDTPSATLVTWLTLAQVQALDANETALIEGSTKLLVAKAKAKVIVKGAEISAMKELGLNVDEMKELMAIA